MQQPRLLWQGCTSTRTADCPPRPEGKDTNDARIMALPPIADVHRPQRGAGNTHAPASRPIDRPAAQRRGNVTTRSLYPCRSVHAAAVACHAWCARTRCPPGGLPSSTALTSEHTRRPDSGSAAAARRSQPQPPPLGSTPPQNATAAGGTLL